MIVPQNKREAIKNQLRERLGQDKGLGLQLAFVDKLADANIPVSYWFLKYKDYDNKMVKGKVTSYIGSMDDHLITGRSLCFAGTYGTGKTYSMCSTLKSALIKGHSAYYTTLNDLVFYLSKREFASRYYHRVTRADFLAIDEVDARHFADTVDSSNYFGSNFERVLRYRVQNRLPLLLATNNESLEKVFLGQHASVAASLSALSIETIPVLGKDHRKKKKAPKAGA